MASRRASANRKLGKSNGLAGSIASEQHLRRIPAVAAEVAGDVSRMIPRWRWPQLLTHPLPVGGVAAIGGFNDRIHHPTTLRHPPDPPYWQRRTARKPVVPALFLMFTETLFTVEPKGAVNGTETVNDPPVRTDNSLRKYSVEAMSRSIG